MVSGGVVGFRATPASAPPSRITARVRCRCVTTSGWTEMLATPASRKSGIRLSGLSTIRCTSTGRSVCGTSEAATGGPKDRLGTKWLSMVSKCTNAAPPALALLTSSASRAKSAARIEGPPTSPPSNSENNPMGTSRTSVISEAPQPQRGMYSRFHDVGTLFVGHVRHPGHVDKDATLEGAGYALYLHLERREVGDRAESTVDREVAAVGHEGAFRVLGGRSEGGLAAEGGERRHGRLPSE